MNLSEYGQKASRRIASKARKTARFDLLKHADLLNSLVERGQISGRRRDELMQNAIENKELFDMIVLKAVR